MTTQAPKLTQDQLQTFANHIYSNHYQHFLGYISEHCLGDDDEREAVNERLEEDGLDPLPSDFNWKDIILTDFEMKIEMGYRN
jgi:hypothetical protein